MGSQRAWAQLAWSTKTPMVLDRRPSPLTPHAGDLVGVRSLEQPPLPEALQFNYLSHGEAGRQASSPTVLELEATQGWKGSSELLLCGVLAKGRLLG